LTDPNFDKTISDELKVVLEPLLGMVFGTVIMQPPKGEAGGAPLPIARTVVCVLGGGVGGPIIHSCQTNNIGNFTVA